MAWVYAVAKADIDNRGRICLSLEDFEVREGRRPIEPTEGFSPNPEGLQAIRVRRPGLWSSPVFLGGATVVQVPFDRLWTLGPNSIDRLRDKYGPWDENFLLAAVRNTLAPAIWNVAEPFGGSAEIADLKLARILELAELCLYRDTYRPGWVSFQLDDSRMSEALYEEQCRVWAALDKTSVEGGVASVLPLWLGSDIFVGQRCIVSAGPVGDLSIVDFVRLGLSGENWCIRDGELGENGHPLNRKMVAVARREGRSPIMFEFAPDGGLDPCGLHIPLSGEVLEYNISHLFREALGPYGLGWLG